MKQERKIAVGSTLRNGRYKLLRECGSGAFSTVYAAEDTQSKRLMAVKVMKKEFAADAVHERKALTALGQAFPSSDSDLLRLLDYFTEQQKVMLVYPLLGPTLRSRKLGVAPGAMAPDTFTRFAASMLQTLRKLELARIVHTDLKPENICTRDNQEDWTIVDYGNASVLRREGDTDKGLVATRYYRPPEVILGHSWGSAVDMWSLGCILYEVFAGKKLFDVPDSDHEHLMQIERIIGRIPEELIVGSPMAALFHPVKRHVLPDAKRVAKIEKLQPLRAALASHPQLADLLSHMLDPLPSRRLTAADALRHPFFAPAVPELNTPSCDDICDILSETSHTSTVPHTIRAGDGAADCSALTLEAAMCPRKRSTLAGGKRERDGVDHTDLADCVAQRQAQGLANRLL
jgi:serine/threonine protein kinase